MVNKGILFCIVILAGFVPVKINAQSVLDTIRVEAFITPEGDTIPQSWLPTVEVSAKQTNQWRNYWRDWTRLRNAVYITYPYAKTASKVISEVNAQLVNVKDENLRKQIIKAREKELKRDFADKITKLSVYQGKVLMKLINRETGNNCYSLIQEFKGNFNAGFWQAVAFVFGSSLKQPYEPKGDDRDIEKIVLELQKMYGYKG
ncbi:MAG: DUF4294 domain-containing protein [Chitinophagia bacterium]|jgi:hypothetical protein|nr:DUF4294 domain-containing protein [Chitinophagia bacterium]